MANDGSLFTFRTNLKASRYRLVRVDLSEAGPPETWSDVVPEGPDLLAGAVALLVRPSASFCISKLSHLDIMECTGV